MKIFKLLVVFLVFSCRVYGQMDNEILWHPKYKLKWDDFQATPIKGHKAAALTNASVQLQLKFEENTFKIDTRVFFRKKGSWVRPNALQDNLLQHEQTHFDIYELFARQLRKQLLEMSLNPSPQKSAKLMQQYFKKNQKKAKKMQKKYDKETDFSRKMVEQKRWSRQIDEELIKLNEFSHPFLELKVSKD